MFIAALIYNSQDLETTEVSINRWMPDISDFLFFQETKKITFPGSLVVQYGPTTSLAL